MSIFNENDLLFIGNYEKGSVFVSNGNSNGDGNITLDKLINDGILSPDGYLTMSKINMASTWKIGFEKAGTLVKRFRTYQ